MNRLSPFIVTILVAISLNFLLQVIKKFRLIQYPLNNHYLFPFPAWDVLALVLTSLRGTNSWRLQTYERREESMVSYLLRWHSCHRTSININCGLQRLNRYSQPNDEARSRQTSGRYHWMGMESMGGMARRRLSGNLWKTLPEKKQVTKYFRDTFPGLFICYIALISIKTLQ